ncbi:HAD family hydrolase [Bacteroides thetaiotaomicron]|uniref:HAD family hydrolase n=1 Tax=Bacteroides thetaiotaomicron TaxID=818 RepID=UPI001B8AEF74|nr:HAD-IA family hydrolase [Bacteroides thetaiotaomicron]QUT73003.1 Phosphoglycolate phosphatase [Bacteroides thetaiotaomicron]
MKSIIFDLDLTLVDSTIAESARKAKDWQLVYSLIPQFSIYDGLENVFDIIRKHDIKVCIVSTAPRIYIGKVVDYFHIPCRYIIGFHDVKPIKPNPAPMLKAVELMNESTNNVISFGDRVIDIQASNSANIESVACFWGTKEKSELILSKYRHAIINPNEILTLIR